MRSTPKRILIILIFLISVIGCKNTKTETGKVEEIAINTDESIQHAKYSDFIEKVSYIPLESGKENTIGQIDKIILYDNVFYIFDFKSAKSLFRFSIDGKYLGKISQTGHGPGEFMYPDDFTIDTLSKHVIILESRKMMLFSLDGTFIKSIQLPFSACKFELINSNEIVFYTGNIEKCDDIFITDGDGNIRAKYWKYNEYTARTLNSPFQKLGDQGVLYLKNLDNTIYQVENAKVFPYRKVTFQANEFTDNDIESLKQNEDNINNYHRIKYYNETASHVFIIHLFKKQGYFTIYSKESRKANTLDVKTTNNDVGIPNVFLANINYDEAGRGISYINPYQLVDNKAIENDQLKAIAQKISTNDNPILLIIDYK